MVVTLGSGPAATDTWTVKTSSASPAVAQPSVLTPTNNATGVGTASGLTLTSGTYTASGGAGAQANSEWEIYTGGYPLGPSTNTISLVTPGTAGTPGTVQYKNVNFADPNPTLAQNIVYGKIAQDNALAAGQPTGTYPLFEWVNGINTGAGINGYKDWYIPATNELAVLYFFLKPDITANNTSAGWNGNSVTPYTQGTVYGPGFPSQTTSTLFRTGGGQAFSTADLYSSATESSSNTGAAWRQFFSSGGQNFTFAKNAGYYARAIRRIPIAEYTAAGSPAIGTYLKGGFYGGQISTAGNGTADYALIVAPAAQGTYGYTGGTNASLTIAGANTDGFQVGFTIKGNTSNATGVILSINATTITYLPTSGTFVTGETISTDPASYSQILGSPFTVTTTPLTSLTVAKPPLAANTTYYARVRYTSQATVVTSNWSGWQKFTTGSMSVTGVTILGTSTLVVNGFGKSGSVYYLSEQAPIKGYSTSNDLTTWNRSTQLTTIDIPGIPSTTAGIVASSTSNTIYFSSNGGTSWSNAQTGTPGSFIFPYVKPTDRSVVLAGVNSNNYYRSTNGGSSYTLSTGQVPTNVNPPAWQGNNVFQTKGGGTTGVGVKSTDNGATWTNLSTIPSPMSSNTPIFASSGSRLLCTTQAGQATAFGRKVAYSDDQGGTWTVVNSPTSLTTVTTSQSLFYYGGAFILVDQGATYLKFHFSPDGITWTSSANINSSTYGAVNLSLPDSTDPNNADGIIAVTLTSTDGTLFIQLS
jgi:hypothetical protein